MKRPRPMILGILGIAILIVVTSGTLLAIGSKHRMLVRRCKELHIGATEDALLVAMESGPTRQTQINENARVLRRLFFDPSRLIPSGVAQDIYVDVDVSTGRVVRIVCDENFSRGL